MKELSLLPLVFAALCCAFSRAAAADEARTAEIDRRLGEFSYGSHSNENIDAFIQLCRGYPEAISLLVKTAAGYNDTSAGQESFRFICYLLKKLGPEAAPATPFLLERLAERYPDRIRYEAASTLGVISKDSSAVSVLMELVKTGRDPSLRSAAAISLGSIGDPAAIPQLVIALSDPDANVRTFTAGAFGDFDPADLEARAHAKIVAAVDLRPHFRNLSPIDAQQFQVDISYDAVLLIDEREHRTSPTRYLCDDDALTYEVTTPRGKKYRLTPRSTFVPPRQPARFNYGTYDVIDAQGIRWSDVPKYWFRWKESDIPRFDEVGTYRIKQTGIFKDERGTSKSIAFESNEMCYEVSTRFASHANLLRRAHEQLERDLGIENPCVQESIREDKDETKIVTLHVSKEDYPEARVTTRGRGTYSGMRYVCRFTGEGRLLSAVASPSYHILCP